MKTSILECYIITTLSNRRVILAVVEVATWHPGHKPPSVNPVEHG